VIVPLFALANAGVDLRGGALGDALSSPLTWAIVAGLVLGKTIGITVGALGAVRARLGQLPQGVGEGQVVGGAALSGIGFTVSLLIAGLAFEDSVLVEEAKIGVLLAAALAVAAGWIAFKLAAVLRGEVSAGLPTILDPPFDPGRDHVRGPLDAPLTLVEFADFECPFCGRATGMVKELRRRFGDDLRYSIRHLPLVDVHPHAELAAQAMEEAAAQGRFWEMHDKLFDHQDELEFEDLLGYAGRIGIDVEELARAPGRPPRRARARARDQRRGERRPRHADLLRQRQTPCRPLRRRDARTRAAGDRPAAGRLQPCHDLSRTASRPRSASRRGARRGGRGPVRGDRRVAVGRQLPSPLRTRRSRAGSAHRGPIAAAQARLCHFSPSGRA